MLFFPHMFKEEVWSETRLEIDKQTEINLSTFTQVLCLSTILRYLYLNISI